MHEKLRGYLRNKNVQKIKEILVDSGAQLDENEIWQVRQVWINVGTDLAGLFEVCLPSCTDPEVLVQELCSTERGRVWFERDWKSVAVSGHFAALVQLLLELGLSVNMPICRRILCFTALFELSVIHAECSKQYGIPFFRSEHLKALLHFVQRSPNVTGTVSLDKLSSFLVITHLPAVMASFPDAFFEIVSSTIGSALHCKSEQRTVQWRYHLCTWTQFAAFLCYGQAPKIRNLISSELWPHRAAQRRGQGTSWNSSLPPDDCLLELKVQLQGRGLLDVNQLANVSLLILKDSRQNALNMVHGTARRSDNDVLTLTSCRILRNLKLDIGSPTVEKLVPTILHHLIHHSQLVAFKDVFAVFKQCAVFGPLQVSFLPSVAELQQYKTAKAVFGIAYVLAVVAFFERQGGSRVGGSSLPVQKHRQAILDYWALLHQQLSLNQFMAHVHALSQSCQFDRETLQALAELEALVVSSAEPLFTPNALFLSFGAPDIEQFSVKPTKAAVDWIATQPDWSFKEKSSALSAICRRLEYSDISLQTYILETLWRHFKSDTENHSALHFVRAWTHLAKLGVPRAFAVLMQLVDARCGANVSFISSVYDPVKVCVLLLKQIPEFDSPDVSTAVLALVRILMLYSRQFWNFISICWGDGGVESTRLQQHLLEKQDMTIITQAICAAAKSRSTVVHKVSGNCLHSFLQDEIVYVRLLCSQTFSTEAVPFAVKYIPCFHVAIENVSPLLTSSSASERLFGVKLLVAFFETYPMPNLWSIAQELFLPQLAQVAAAALGPLSETPFVSRQNPSLCVSTYLGALQLCEAYPFIVESVVNHLAAVKQELTQLDISGSGALALLTKAVVLFICRSVEAIEGQSRSKLTAYNNSLK